LAHHLVRIQLNEGRQPTGLFLARFMRALSVDLKYSIDQVKLASHSQYLPGVSIRLKL
jgi:hypothetical protein